MKHTKPAKYDALKDIKNRESICLSDIKIRRRFMIVAFDTAPYRDFNGVYNVEKDIVVYIADKVPYAAWRTERLISMLRSAGLRHDWRLRVPFVESWEEWPSGALSEVWHQLGQRAYLDRAEHDRSRCISFCAHAGRGGALPDWVLSECI